LAHAGLVTRLAPAPLADRDAARLFDHLVTDAPPALRARLLARAQGIPFYLVSCAQAVRAGAMTTDTDGTGDTNDAVALAMLPWDVAQSVRPRRRARCSMWRRWWGDKPRAPCSLPRLAVRMMNCSRRWMSPTACVSWRKRGTTTVSCTT